MTTPAVPAYAAPSDLAAWLGLFLSDGVTGDPRKLPPTGLRSLRSACKAVRERTVTWFFAADPDTGLPVDPDQAAALQTATLEQAEALITNTVDPTAGGTLDATVESSVSVQSVRVTLAGAEQAAASRAATIAGLCPEAERTLALAGIPTQVWVVG